MSNDLELQARLRFVAAALARQRDLWLAQGWHWPLALEGALAVASQRQQAPDVEPGSALLVTYAQAARRLAISGRTLDRMVARGELAPVEVTPGCKRFAVADLENFVSSRARR